MIRGNFDVCFNLLEKRLGSFQVNAKEKTMNFKTISHFSAAFTLTLLMISCGSQSSGKRSSATPPIFGSLPETIPNDVEPVNHGIGPGDAVNLDESDRCKILSEQIAFNQARIIEIENVKRASIKNLIAEGYDYFAKPTVFVEVIGSNWFSLKMQAGKKHYKDNPQAIDSIDAVLVTVSSEIDLQNQLLQENNLLIKEQAPCF